MDEIVLHYCRRGHEQVPENLYVAPRTGKSQCAICRKGRASGTMEILPNGKAFRRKSLAERLWEKVNKAPGQGPNGECWEWIGTKNIAGYGYIATSGSPCPAHRIAYELTHGTFDNELFVLHCCDNRACVNPAHLFLGTHRENMEDMLDKGRHWQQKKTHCKNGHEFTADNTRLAKGQAKRQTRVCKTCQAISGAKREFRLTQERRAQKAAKIAENYVVPCNEKCDIV